MLLFFFSVLAIFAKAIAYDSSYSLSSAQRYIGLSGAAYCTDPVFTKNTVDNWSCKACAAFPNVTATSFHASKTDGHGFVGYDGTANEVIISFSGTDPLSIQNWIDDLDFIKATYPYCSGCEVHKGFYDTYLAVQSQVLSLLKSYKSSHSSAKISITGHSLGAALAAHCAADLIHAGYSISTLYTYGMPRVGNQAFEQWYTTVVPGTFRVVHNKDPVPHLAPENWGFHHMPYEIFYTKNYDQWKLCSVEGEDKTCSDQYLLDLNVANHLVYLDFDMISNYLSCEL